MPLQLWLGGSGSGKSHRLYETIIKEAGEHTDINYYVLVPEQFTLQTQRDIVMQHPDGGIINIDVLSFNRLAYRIFEEVGFKENSGIVIDDMGKNLILRHLAGEYEKELKVIGGNLKKLGYITEVKSVISEFMQYGVNDEKIARLRSMAELNNRHYLCDMLDDIKVLYDAFKDYIKDKYLATEELLSRASTAMSESNKLKNSVVVLDGFTGFTPVQYEFIESLMRLCKDIHVTVLSDRDRGMDIPYDENDLFFLSYKTVRELKHLAEQNHFRVNKDIIITDDIPIRYRLTDKTPNMLVHLEKNIFRQNDQLNNMCNDCEAADIRILSATNPLEEMSYVAVMIDDLVRNKGMRYKDIAIVSGELDTYMHSADRIFKRYNIPYFIDKKQPILLNPFIEYMRSVMRVLSENYSFDAMFSYLKSSLPGIDPDSVNRLENYCLAKGIKGKKKWNNKFIKHADDIDEEGLIELNRIREEVIAPFALFDGCSDVKSYCEALYHVITQHNIQQKLKNRSDEFEKSGNMLLSKEYIMLYPKIMDLLDKLVELLGDEKMAIDEFYELLNAGFDELRIGIIPCNTDYVQVGDLTRSRFRDIKALFFVGVNEGIVPASSASGGIISDIDREFFSEKGSGVELAPTSRMQAYTQRLYLYMVMTKPTEKLYISYSRVGEDGKAIAPSYLIKEIKSMYSDIMITDYSELSVKERVCNEGTGLNELAYNMQDFIKKMEKNPENTSNEGLELFEFFAQNEKYQKELKNLIESAFVSPKDQLTDSVTSKIAHVIYGETIYGSVTRLEKYAKCSYEHFLKYGLRLRQREEFKFDISDMGSVFHKVLERFATLLNESGKTWASISEEEACRLTIDAVQTVTNQESALYDSFRTSYMVKRIERIMLRSVSTLRNHVIKGDFIPSKFEYEFSESSDLSAINFRLNNGERLRLNGRIDRMDLLEDNDRILVKIIDYKSGNKDIDLAAVYRGEQLQLVVYMNAAVETLKKQYPDKEIVPAGILYYHLTDPIIDAQIGEEDDVIRERIRNQLCMTGLVNDDKEIIEHMDNDYTGKSSSIVPLKAASKASKDDFKVISDYVNKTITDMGNEMLSGKIKATPGNCKYCEFSSVCKMTDADGEIKTTIKPELALELMREEVNGIH